MFLIVVLGGFVEFEEIVYYEGGWNVVVGMYYCFDGYFGVDFVVGEYLV